MEIFFIRSFLTIFSCSCNVTFRFQTIERRLDCWAPFCENRYPGRMNSCSVQMHRNGTFSARPEWRIRDPAVHSVSSSTYPNPTSWWITKKKIQQKKNKEILWKKDSIQCALSVGRYFLRCRPRRFQFFLKKFLAQHPTQAGHSLHSIQ